MKGKELQDRIRQAQARKTGAATPERRPPQGPAASTGVTGFAVPGVESDHRQSSPSLSATFSRGGASSSAKKDQNSDQLLSCGFSKKEADFLHEAVKTAKMQWFEGDGMVMARKEGIELNFRPGQSQDNRWVVMAFPVIDMNLDGAVDVAMHFLVESFTMAHTLEVQFQAVININTEKLEFVLPLPLEGLSSQNLGLMIDQFVTAMAQGVQEELSRVLSSLREAQTEH